MEMASTIIIFQGTDDELPHLANFEAVKLKSKPHV